MKHKSIEKTILPPDRIEGTDRRISPEEMKKFWDNFDRLRYESIVEIHKNK